MKHTSNYYAFIDVTNWTSKTQTELSSYVVEIDMSYSILRHSYFLKLWKY